MSLSTFFSIFKEAFQGWQKDRATVWCAALAYFTVFSLGPLLLLIVSIAGLFISKTNIEGSISTQLRSTLGQDSANLVSGVLQSTDKPATSVVGTVVGFVTLVLGAIGVFGQLQQMLDQIWGVTPKPQSGVIGLIRSRLLNFSMVGVIAFLLLVSFLASTAISGLGTYVGSILPFSASILEIINFVLSFVIITVLFAFVLKVLPDVNVPWSNIWVSSAITSLLFTIGKAVIGIYIGHSGTSSTYGAAASLIVLLLWVYYSAQILFFGAEFTKAYTLKRNQIITPSKFATLEESTTQTEHLAKPDHMVAKITQHFIKGFLDELKEKSSAE